MVHSESNTGVELRSLRKCDRLCMGTPIGMKTAENKSEIFIISNRFSFIVIWQIWLIQQQKNKTKKLQLNYKLRLTSKLVFSYTVTNRCVFKRPRNTAVQSDMWQYIFSHMLCTNSISTREEPIHLHFDQFSNFHRFLVILLYLSVRLSVS